MTSLDILLLAALSPFQSGLIWTLCIGLLAGGLARLLVPGKDPIGCWLTPVLGIAGAFLAVFLGQALGWYKVGESTGFIGATVGSVILLLIYRAVKPKV